MRPEKNKSSGRTLKFLIAICIMLLFASVTTQTVQAGTDTVQAQADADQAGTDGTQTKADGSQTGTDTSKTAANTTKKSGWVGDSYYRNGKAVSGWQTIDGYTYYFKNHKLQRSTIAGTKATGRYYVGPDGVKVDNPTMNRAVKFVLANSKASDSAYKRLQSCCTAIMKYHYLHMDELPPKASKLSTYADYMLTHHNGNCYRYGVTMAYVALALGYKARVVAGGVTANMYRTNLWRHGWCEIKSAEGWRIWDLSMQRSFKSGLLNILRADYPYHIRALYVYNCTISKGKITWKRKSTSWANTKITAIY